MALTEEQIKNLKPGDPIIIHGTFKRIFEDGDIVSRIKTTDLRGKVVDSDTCIRPSCVSLSQENMKRDSYCEFKKGDIVREVSWDGIEPKGLGNIYEVEANDGTVIMLRNNPCNIALAPCFLELVYSKDEPDNNVDRNRDEEVKVTKTDRFKITSAGYKFAVVERNHDKNIIAYFPFKSVGDPHLDDKETALKRAVDYRNYLNDTYESEQERQKL